jgi:hypothetical protein
LEEYDLYSADARILASLLPSEVPTTPGASSR